MLRATLLLFTGLAAGAIGALLGLGGGIILVPALTLGFRLPARQAIGTSLVGVLATSASVGGLSDRGGQIDIPLALRLEVASAAGAMLGGVLGGLVTTRVLSVLFALIVFGTAAYTVIHGRHTGLAEALAVPHYTPRNWLAGLAISVVAGTASGLLGIGGGFIKVPTMYAVMGVPLGISTATSNFMVGVTAAASLFVYLGRGDIRGRVTALCAVGVAVGAAIGGLLKAHVGVTLLRWALVLLMLGIAAQVLWKGF